MSARQFDVFANPDRDSAGAHPYFLVLQHDALDDLNTRLVAPLIAPKHVPFFERLMPRVEIRGARYVVDVTNIGAIPARLLQKSVANLDAARYDIIAALDLVFTGI